VYRDRARLRKKYEEWATGWTSLLTPGTLANARAVLIGAFDGSAQKGYFMKNSTMLFPELPVLETERIVLRKMTLNDAEDMFAYASDPEAAKYVTWDSHRTVEDSRAFLRSTLDCYAQHVPANWGLVLKATGHLVGTCGFMSWFSDHGRAEIGFALGREYWGQGLMTEAVRHVICWGFSECNLNRIEGECKLENFGSARVMVKCGMTFEGVLRQFVFAKGQYHDVRLYAILRQEWLAVKGVDSLLHGTTTGGEP
jgi:ribosomal-protein-alanine N-acetyltransferase